MFDNLRLKSVKARHLDVVITLFATFSTLSGTAAIADTQDCKEMLGSLKASTRITLSLSTEKRLTAEVRHSMDGRELELRDDTTKEILDLIYLTNYGRIVAIKMDEYKYIAPTPEKTAILSEPRGHWTTRHYVNYRPVVYLLEADKLHILEYFSGVGLISRRTFETHDVAYVEPISVKVKDTSGQFRYVTRDTVKIYFKQEGVKPIIYDPISTQTLDPAKVFEIRSRDPVMYL